MRTRVLPSDEIEPSWIRMSHIDFDRLEAIDPDEYRAQKPYPWANPVRLLRPESFDALRTRLPDISHFEAFFGKDRKGGQEPHDRFQLEYKDDSPVPTVWREFIEELKSARYRRHMCRLLDVRSVSVNFHWHYTPPGCSVSPHCDSKRKLGSHVFYLNTEDDWKASWGGQTVILDDGGNFPTESAPCLEDFDAATECESVGNKSLIFTRKGHSWHAVREVTCPAGDMRRVFIVVLNDDTLVARLRNRMSGKDIQRY